MHARIVPILLRGSRGSVRSSDLSTTTQSRSRIPPAPGSLPPQTRQADVKQENSRSLVQEAGAAGDGRVGTHRAVGPSSWAEVPKASSGRRSGWVRGRAGPGVGTPGGRERTAERWSEREAEGAQAVLGADCEQWGWRRALGRSEGHPRAQGEESNKQTALLWPYRWAAGLQDSTPKWRETTGLIRKDEKQERYSLFLKEIHTGAGAQKREVTYPKSHSTTLDKRVGTSSVNTECLAHEKSKVDIFTEDHQGKES
ncbi:potassium voltage-gated channel subfamily E member 3 isoform X2 [Bos javanicus]|uniref:potassium voltage-gated channel subfamily E member 3 isoform X2 n=1 Tax=Bos javanicus TaxID=9906 RepID=UPI002AA7C38D|nr:potassium voltage-gated channel subfamily E member 3 isoform X2 [Bos javanicus]